MKCLQWKNSNEKIKQSTVYCFFEIGMPLDLIFISDNQGIVLPRQDRVVQMWNKGKNSFIVNIHYLYWCCIQRLIFIQACLQMT